MICRYVRFADYFVERDITNREYRTDGTVIALGWYRQYRSDGIGTTYSDDTRSLIPVISVHFVSNLLYRWQSCA